MGEGNLVETCRGSNSNGHEDGKMECLWAAVGGADSCVYQTGASGQSEAVSGWGLSGMLVSVSADRLEGVSIARA